MDEEIQSNGRLSLATLLQDKTLLSLEVGGHSLSVCYRPAALQSGHTMAEGLKACIVDFGLDGADGKPIPVSDDGLAQVPWALQRRIWEAVLSESYPN